MPTIKLRSQIGTETSVQAFGSNPALNSTKLVLSVEGISATREELPGIVL